MAGEGRQSPPGTSGPAPGGLDTSVPHIARVYDYWLGGKDNFAVDREAAEQVMAAYPGILRDVRAQRAFLTHAVGYLAGPLGIPRGSSPTMKGSK
jgi:S-adenosyl methyltransferase